MVYIPPTARLYFVRHVNKRFKFITQVPLNFIIKIPCSKLFQLTQHDNTQKHKDNLEKFRNRGKQQTFLEASSSGTFVETDPFVQDLCDMFIGGYTIQKIENEAVRYFLSKYTGRIIPSKTTMQRKLAVCFRAVNKF